MTSRSFVLVAGHAPIWPKLCHELARHDVKLCGIVGSISHFRQELRFPEAPIFDQWEHNHGVPAPARHDAREVEQLYQGLVARGIERKIIELIGRLSRGNRYLPFYEHSSLFKLYINYALTIFAKRPDFLLCYETPHSPFTYALLECAVTLGIDVVRSNQNPIVPTLFIDRNDRILACGNERPDDWMMETFDRWFTSQTADYSAAVPAYMTKQKQRLRWNRAKNFNKGLSRASKWLRGKRSDEPHYVDFDQVKLTRKGDASAWHYWRRAFDGADVKLKALYESHATDDWRSSGRPFAYLPMHYQPEKTSNPEGNAFYDQQNLILALRARIPAEYNLVVREHPSQFYMFDDAIGWRSENYYKAAMALEGVYFASVDVNPFELTDRCAELFTLTGTAGIEAALRNKPATYLGRAWYGGCPSMRDLSHGLTDTVPLRTDLKVDRQAIRNFLVDRIVKAPIGACNPSGYKYFRKFTPYTYALDQVEMIATAIAAEYAR